MRARRALYTAPHSQSLVGVVVVVVVVLIKQIERMNTLLGPNLCGSVNHEGPREQGEDKV